MPLTPWDLTTPAGSEALSNGDNRIRELKAGVQDRIAVDHSFANDANDGKHTQVRLRPANDITPITSDAGNSLTGSIAGGLIQLIQTWNTTGICAAIYAAITNTASDASSLLVKLVVNGVTKFAIDMNGNIVIGGGGGGGGAATPTGSVLAFAGSAAPTGFLMCNGAAVSRTTYAALFGVIGTAYGAGDGVGTFNVPDMRQKFPLGKAAAGTGSTLGAAGGAIDHTHTGAAHTHTYTDVIDHTHAIGITDPTHEHLVHGIPAQSEFVAPFASGGTPHNFVWADNAGDYISPGPAATGITAAAASPAGAVATGTTASAGAGATSANNPPYLVTNYIIAQ